MNKILLTIILFTSLQLVAQGPPITVGTPVMLGLEGGGIRTFGKFISKENSNIYIQPFVIPYNITPKFQVGTILPFVFKMPDNSTTVGGFGDMALFAKYQLYKKDGKAKTFRTLIKLSEGEATMNVPKGKEPKKEELEIIIQDAGFTPREITFSDKAFNPKEDK